MWRIIEHICEPLLTFFGLNYYFPETSLIARLFIQESVCTSCRSILTNLGIETFSSEISFLAKILFYCGVSGFYYVFNILTWNNFPNIYLYYFILFISSPLVLEWILLQQASLLEKLEEFQRSVVSYTTSMALAKTLNHICIQNLHSNPKITARELNEVFYMQNYNYIWIFLKILLVTSIIKYLKQSNIFWGRLVNFLYNSGQLIKIPNTHQSVVVDANVRDPRKVLSVIVSKRKWHYFYDPSVLNLVIRVYQDQEGNLLQELWLQLQQQTLQFFSLMTLSSLIPLPILSFLFRIKQEYPINLVIPVLDLVLYFFFPDQIFWISMFTAYCSFFNVNMLMSLFYYMKNMIIPGIFSIIFHQNKYNLYLMYAIPTTYFLAQQPNKLCLLIPPLIAKYNFIYIWMIFFGMFSEYDLIHLASITSILYLVINAVDYRTTTQQKKTQNIDIIGSYWPEQNRSK